MVVTSPGKTKIDPLVQIENLRKENEELKKNLPWLKNNFILKMKLDWICWKRL